MKLTNNFSDETRELFIWNNECWWCGTNKPDALHHIVGRKSDRPLNAAPIHNFKCHIGNGKLDTFKNKNKLLNKTLIYLKQNGYKLTTEDKKFMEKHKKLYEYNKS